MKVLFAALFLTVSLYAETMSAVLARMDAAAQQFRAVSANMKRAQFTAILNETTTTEGSMRLRRTKNGTVGRIEFKDPEPRTVAVNGKSIQIFYPKANVVEIYDASKYISNIDQLLLLGFGATSKDLSKSYEFHEGGVEKVQGITTTRLELLPRSAELKRLVNKIELWFPEGQANPIREKITAPSKNYDLVDYTDIKVNPSIPDSDFTMALPGNVKKVYPQK